MVGSAGSRDPAIDRSWRARRPRTDQGRDRL